MNTVMEGGSKELVDFMLYVTNTTTPSQQDEDKVVPDRFRLAARHERRDYRAPDEAKAGGEYVASSFVGNFILGRYRPDQGDEVPDHVPMKGRDDILKSLQTIQRLEDGSFSAGEFHIVDQDILELIYDTTQGLDWEKVQTVVYAVHPLRDGSVYSPAWNSFHLIFADDMSEDPADAAMWIMQAAHSNGTAATKYPNPTTDAYAVSRSGHRFTPMSDVDNWFGYAMKPNAYGAIDFVCKLYHSDHEPTLEELEHSIDSPGASESFFLEVNTTLTPATESDLSAHDEIFVDNGSAEERAYDIILKGALMYGLVAAYYPSQTPGTNMNMVELDPTGTVTLINHAVGNFLDVFQEASTDLWEIAPHPVYSQE